MDKILTIKQIQEQFPDEWVFVANPKTDRAYNLRSGRVVWHSPDRDEIHRKVMEFRPKHFAVFFNRTTPDETIYVL